ALWPQGVPHRFSECGLLFWGRGRHHVLVDRLEVHLLQHPFAERGRLAHLGLAEDRGPHLGSQVAAERLAEPGAGEEDGFQLHQTIRCALGGDQLEDTVHTSLNPRPLPPHSARISAAPSLSMRTSFEQSITKTVLARSCGPYLEALSFRSSARAIHSVGAIHLIPEGTMAPVGTRPALPAESVDPGNEAVRGGRRAPPRATGPIAQARDALRPISTEPFSNRRLADLEGRRDLTGAFPAARRARRSFLDCVASSGHSGARPSGPPP